MGLSLLLSPGNAAELLPSERDAVFREAGEAYDRGDFAAAAAGYEKISGSGWKSAALFYNLGNAWFKQGNLGRAVLNYRRAEILEPLDPEIGKNLEYAREALEDDAASFAPGTWTRIKTGPGRMLPLNDWALLTLVFYWVTVVVALGALLSASLRRFRGPALKTLGVLLVLAALSTWQARAVSREEPAVILSPRVEVRYSPGLEQTEAFVLHEGTEVRVIRRDEGARWLQIALPDGKSGWVPAASLELINGSAGA